ncbi:hypothetical protein RFI_40140, partial [Reticulomyxa filosa]
MSDDNDQSRNDEPAPKRSRVNFPFFVLYIAYNNEQKCNSLTQVCTNLHTRIGGIASTLGSYWERIISCIKKQFRSEAQAQQSQQQDEDEHQQQEEYEHKQPEQQQADQVEERQGQPQQQDQQSELEPTNSFQRLMMSMGKNYKTPKEMWEDEERKERIAEQKAKEI